MGASGRHDHERIIGCDAGPARRKRAIFIRLVAVENSELTPAMDAVDQIELTAEQRVKGVGYPKTSLLNIRIECIRQPTPTPTWSE